MVILSNLLEQTIVFASAIVLAFLTFIIIIIICHKLQKKKLRQQSLSSDVSSLSDDPPPSYGDVGIVNSSYNPDVRFYNGSESHRYNERAVDVGFDKTVNTDGSPEPDDKDVSTSKDMAEVIVEDADTSVSETKCASENEQNADAGETSGDNQQENLENENAEKCAENQVENKNGEANEESVFGSMATKFTNWWKGT